MDRHQDQVRFSVVIPAYNEADYLSETLQSLRDQDFDGPYEVIVVDNHSTDETASVAATFGVRLLHEAERGVCAARQRGSAAAAGEIIVSTDADTVPPRNWLRSLDATFAAHRTPWPLRDLAGTRTPAGGPGCTRRWCSAWSPGCSPSPARSAT